LISKDISIWRYCSTIWIDRLNIYIRHTDAKHKRFCVSRSTIASLSLYIYDPLYRLFKTFFFFFFFQGVLGTGPTKFWTHCRCYFCQPELESGLNSLFNSRGHNLTALHWIAFGQISYCFLFLLSRVLTKFGNKIKFVRVKMARPLYSTIVVTVRM
jgi:hypothetical protein